MSFDSHVLISFTFSTISFFIKISSISGIYNSSFRYNAYGVSDDCPEETSSNVALCFCNNCGKSYKHLKSLARHTQFECGKEPRFKCPVTNCIYKTKQASNMKRHCRSVHNRSITESLANITNTTFS